MGGQILEQTQYLNKPNEQSPVGDTVVLLFTRLLVIALLFKDILQ